MGKDFFHFKQFSVRQDKCAMKVGTDSVLLGSWADINDVKKILDVGSGTGLLCLMMAQRSERIYKQQMLNDLSINGIEIDPDAFEQSIINCKNSKWSERISIQNISFQKFILNSNSKFDLIISNPPYFQNDLQSPDEIKNKARHNKELNFTELSKGVKKLLTNEGKFSCILPAREAHRLLEECKKENLHLRKLCKVFSNEEKKRRKTMVNAI